MALSRFAYVRNYEVHDSVLPNVFMVVRIDGKGFHDFSTAHSFAKPNDGAALELMNHAARHVVSALGGECTLAFGESDEYSFLFRRGSALYKRRASKITTHVVSLFTSAYVFFWPRYFPDKPLLHPPSFDGRLVPYPGEKEVRDYFAWRQADTHVNNLYNTVFWALIQQGGQSQREAHQTLSGTVSAEKNEILFSRFGINYDKLPAMVRKGTTLVWGDEDGEGAGSEGVAQGAEDSPQADEEAAEEAKEDQKQASESKSTQSRRRKRSRRVLRTLHVDIISTKPFWDDKNSSSTATRAPTAASSTDEAAAPWEAPDRLSGAGLGKGALR